MCCERTVTISWRFSNLSVSFQAKNLTGTSKGQSDATMKAEHEGWISPPCPCLFLWLAGTTRGEMIRFISRLVASLPPNSSLHEPIPSCNNNFAEHVSTTQDALAGNLRSHNPTCLSLESIMSLKLSHAGLRVCLMDIGQQSDAVSTQ